MLRVVRWLLVVPLALGSVCAAVVLGLFLLRLSDRLCRALGFSEAQCVVTWLPVAEVVVTSVCGVVALLLAALLPAAAAPSGKRAVAIGGVLVGLPLAIWVLVVLAFPLAVSLAFSTLASVLAVGWVWRRHPATT